MSRSEFGASCSLGFVVCSRIEHVGFSRNSTERPEPRVARGRPWGAMDRLFVITELLVIRTRAGDRSAFVRLAEIWEPRLRGHAEHLCAGFGPDGTKKTAVDNAGG